MGGAGKTNHAIVREDVWGNACQMTRRGILLSINWPMGKNMHSTQSSLAFYEPAVPLCTSPANKVASVDPAMLCYALLSVVTETIQPPQDKATPDKHILPRPKSTRSTAINGRKQRHSAN